MALTAFPPPIFSFSYCVFVSLLELVQHCVSVFVSNLPLIFHRKLLFLLLTLCAGWWHCWCVSPLVYTHI